MKPAKNGILTIRTAVLLILIAACLFRPVGVQAFPPLPSSFYGTVKIDGNNVPDGTRVQALIDGHPIVSSLTKTYQGTSVYSLDVLGDDLSSQVVEGGQDASLIRFQIGDVMADQSGAWRSGTNVKLDLTGRAERSDTTSMPRATPSSPAELEAQLVADQGAIPAQPLDTAIKEGVPSLGLAACAVILLVYISIRRRK